MIKTFIWLHKRELIFNYCIYLIILFLTFSTHACADSIILRPQVHTSSADLSKSAINLKELLPANSDYYISWSLPEPVAIPDDDLAWLEVVCDPNGIIVPGNVVTKVELYHNISHTWNGDLEIQLANELHTWQVHSSSDDSTNDYDELLQNFSDFTGDDPCQMWYYRVRDIVGEDVGTLNEMVLKVYYSPSNPAIKLDKESLELDCSDTQLTTTTSASDKSSTVSTTSKLLNQYVIDSKLSRDNSVNVIVNLNPAFITKALNITKAGRSTKEYQNAISSVRSELLSQLKSKKALKVRKQYDNLLSFSATVDFSQLQDLIASDYVYSVEPVIKLELFTAQGLPLMHALDSRSSISGQGIAIAICDTGIDYTHPDLGNGTFPNDKVIGGYDFGSNDADPMPVGVAHGTSCAGIAAGDITSSGDFIGGVAPGAKLYALKVSDDDAENMTNEAVLNAWDWCLTHQYDDPNNPIMVISNSFGSDSFSSVCDTASSAFTLMVEQLNTAGITLLAASGNDGYCSSIAWPSCMSGVISVGAVYDTPFSSVSYCVEPTSCVAEPDTYYDCSTEYYCRNTNSVAGEVTCYSNSASILDILAPSTSVYTTDIAGSDGYTTDDYYSAFGGTSAACPYAAGAVAVLQSQMYQISGTYLTPDQVKDHIKSTGTNIVDGKSAISTPMVDLANALENLVFCSQQSLQIQNIGAETLQVTDIQTPQWISLDPAPPYTVLPSSSRSICIAVDCSPCDGSFISQDSELIIYSNDPDSPALILPVSQLCSVCLQKPTADITGDCMVNVLDLAEIAQRWLDCNLYPAIYCQ